MKREYDEIMEHIQVTPEMRERVLTHIRGADMAAPSQKVLSLSRLKKYWSVAACFVLLLAGAAALPRLMGTGQSEPPLVTVTPNIVEAASPSELSKLTGFAVTEQFTLPFQAAETTYYSYWNELAEIRYSGEGKSAVYRQSAGTEDNSGDFNVYENTAEIAVNGLDIGLKGGDGGYSLAAWTDGEYTYSLNLSYGMAEEAWLAVFSQES